MLKQLIYRNRSYRRFYENIPLNREDILEMIDNARLSASAGNKQVLKYIISNDPELNAKIFPCLAWAGYLEDWPGPDVGERPAAYIIILHDTGLSDNYFCDDGIATQSILLTAVEKGFGGCIIGSVKRDELAKILNLNKQFKILNVIALGKPAESVKIENLTGNDIRYWRDNTQVHHVPKRGIKEIITADYCI